MANLVSVPLIKMDCRDDANIGRFYRDLLFSVDDRKQFEAELEGLRTQLLLLPQTGEDDSLAGTICGPGPSFIVAYAIFSTFRETEGLWSVPPNFVMRISSYWIDPDQARAREIRVNQIEVLDEVRRNYGVECVLARNTRNHLFRLIRETQDKAFRGLIEARLARTRIERAMRRLSVGILNSRST